MFFDGTAEANSSVEVFIDGISIGTTTADGAGDWTFDHTGTTLADGPYSITAQATDVALNVGAVSVGSALTVDTTAPVAPTIDSVSTDSGDSATDEVTNDNTPTITGTAEAGSFVEVSLDAVTIGTVTADGAGNYSITPVSPIADGVYTVAATSTDSAGNSTTTTATDFLTVDTTAPTVAITSDQGTGGDILFDTESPATLTFTLSEDSTTFALGDISVIGSGTLANFMMVSASVYTVEYLSLIHI